MGAGWQRWWWDEGERLARATAEARQVRNGDPFVMCMLCGGEVVEVADRRVDTTPVGAMGRVHEFVEALGRCRRCGMAHVWVVSIRCLDNDPLPVMLKFNGPQYSGRIKLSD